MIAGWDRRGIIPARAGFTPPILVTRARHVDHPRSRGVYVCGAVCGAVGAGSSPLARGLHTPRSWVDSAARIIPARAGFTRRWTCG